MYKNPVVAHSLILPSSIAMPIHTAPGFNSNGKGCAGLGLGTIAALSAIGLRMNLRFLKCKYPKFVIVVGLSP